MRHAARRSIKSIDGVSIYYERDLHASHKPTLMFLHGLGGDLTAWKTEREMLRDQGYTTLALDLRGHGLSSHPTSPEGYDLRFFAQDILQIIKHERIHNPLLVGHCFGGMVAMTTEAYYPKTGRGLVLIDTGYKPPFLASPLVMHPTLKEFLFAIVRRVPDIDIHRHVDFAQFIGTNDIDARRLISDILHTSLRSYLYLCEDLLSFDATTLLHKIKVPTLVIEGEKDSIFPPKVAEEISSRIKHSELALIPNANHILVINNPKDVATQIEKFVDIMPRRHSSHLRS